jgi:hypothetical protein
MKKLSLIIFTIVTLYAKEIVVSGDKYMISNGEVLDIIYTDSMQKEATLTRSFEKEVIKNYEKSYGYSFDEKLHLGLLSANNQIANAFSTQFPFNMQMNYIGGTLMVDYMGTSSWIKTLLLHESAHNFQTNPKKNPLSRIAHKIVKNIPVTSLYFFPIFPVPNSLESPFILEGNAVLNESRFGIGGRLYNGFLLAMSITQARAGYITPQRSYNSHLYFPYGTHHYIVGGFFQLYLAQKYGVDKVNGYFWNFSGQYLPMQTNAIFKMTFGEDFEFELKEYAKWLKDKYSEFCESSGELMATSKVHDKLNSDQDEIFFLTSDAISKPKLNIISKKGERVIKRRDSFFLGEVFKVDGKYYSSTSSTTEVEKIEIGLFDSQGDILDKSRSKILQRVLSDGRFVYFDVNRSFDKPALYVDGEFYEYVNSSVFSDEDDNLYYFKQDGKKRILYKNREPLFSYLGWYGFVVDVDENGIYFVANSKNGSSLFLFQNGEFFRVTKGDDVIDAKLLDNNMLLVTTITANGYDYLKLPTIHKREIPYNRTYFFEHSSDFNLKYDKTEKLAEGVKPYRAYEELSYSSLEQSFIIQEDGVDFNIGANFSDPLMQNSAKIYLSRYDDETIAGVSYENSVFRLRFGADVYGLLEKDSNISSRDFGANFFINYPIYKSGYKSADLNLNYHIDHDKDERRPLSLSLNLSNSKRYGKSMYPNESNTLSLFGVTDRGDFTAGASYNYFHDLPYEFYAGFGLKYAKSDSDEVRRNYGIEINDNTFTTTIDPSIITMPSIQTDLYAKEAFKGGVSLYKVLNYDKYLFTIPVSLRRESLYAKYHYYDITFLNDKSEDFSEFTFGMNFDLIFLHKNPVPLSLEFIYNDKLVDDTRFRVLFDIPL